MTSFPVPPDYSPLREALTRAFDKWGSMDAFNQFKGALRFGKLTAYRLDQSGNVSAYPGETWADPENDYLLHVPNYNRVETREREHATVFLTADLKRELPDFQEQAEAQIAERGTRRATDMEYARSESVSPSISESDKSESGRRKGRPPNIGGDDFWIEAARMVHEGEAGARTHTQEQFIEAMTTWASANMEQPYKDDSVEAKIKKLWRGLKLGNPNG